MSLQFDLPPAPNRTSPPLDTGEVPILLKRPHPAQAPWVYGQKKRQVVRAGRRSGKTSGIAIRACLRFLAGQRVLYAGPTQDQLGRFWTEVKNALEPAVSAGLLHRSDTNMFIERRGTENRITAKTAWNADTLRGDYADELILDEWQLMDEDAWRLVGAPMLIDNNGNATFLYTPPSLHTRSVSMARNKMHAAELYIQAQKNPRWATFHFTSHANPYISREGLAEVTEDLTALARRMEIMAEDVFEAPAALWARSMFEGRPLTVPPLTRIVVGVDPTGTAAGDETGIIVAGIDERGDGWVLADYSAHNMRP